MNSWAPASLAAAITASIGRPGSASAMLSRIVRLNSMFSCSTTPIWRRRLPAVGQGQIDAVGQHAAAFGQVEALRQLGQGALARAGTADDADHLAGGDGEADAAQHFRAVGAVAEDHVVEFDAPGQRWQRRAAARALPCPAGKLGAAC
jgi:hypothetical protein